MKVLRKNLLYQVYFDGTMFEYSASTTLGKAIFRLLELNDNVCIPVAHVVRYRIQKYWLGSKMKLELAENSYKIHSKKLKLIKLIPIWYLNEMELEDSLKSAFNKVIQLNRHNQNVGLYNINPVEIDRTYITSA